MWLNSENLMFRESAELKAGQETGALVSPGKLHKWSELNLYELKQRISAIIKEQNKVRETISCEGVYCNMKDFFENALIDEKDELNNLYLMETNEKHPENQVEFRSIILDIVEKHDLWKRLLAHTDIPKSNLKRLKQGLQLRFRKFFSLNDLKSHPAMAHFKYTHYYSKKHVCSVCYSMYHKLDVLRNEARNTVNYFVLHPEKIK